MIRFTNFNMSPWRLLDEVSDFDRYFSRVLQNVAGAEADSFPRVNMAIGDEGAMVEAIIPGVDPADVEVTVEDRELTISGGGDGEENERGEFTRRFRLPFDIAEDGLTATHKHGVLSISLPKASRAQKRRIAIAQG